MRFSLSDLEAFVAVADRANFRRAAESVHLSQPALSRRIAKLETALGVRLFERTTRAVSLTAVGREFARKARVLLDDLEQALLGTREIAATHGGEVTVACVPSAAYYYLPGFLRRYRARFPRVRVRVVDEAANTVLGTVIRGEADFGINFIGAQEPDIEFAALLEEPFVAACPRDHPLARRRQVTWDELAQHDYLALGRSSGNRVLLDNALARHEAGPRWSCETRHVVTLLGLVEAGLGVAAVPRLALPAGRHPTIAHVPLVEPRVTRTLGLIRRRNRALAPAADELYRLLAAGARPPTPASPATATGARPPRRRATR